MQTIKGYHAHVYYDASTIKQARALCEQAATLFPLKMGRVHERPVGPHPDWSCQLAFGPELAAERSLAVRQLEGELALVHADGQHASHHFGGTHELCGHDPESGDPFFLGGDGVVQTAR